MKPKHILLGILITAIWGFNFVMIKFALQGIPPLLLTAERFFFASLPVLFLPRPQGLTWPRIIAIGSTMFLGQYVFLFISMAHGMPPGLASVLLQIQSFITVIFATVMLHEIPRRQQILGGLVALGGLAVIANTAGAATDIPLTAIGFILLGACCWAIGNVLLKKAGPTTGGGTLAGVAWLSLAPPVPAFLLSLYFDGAAAVVKSLGHPGVLPLLALGFIVIFSTWLAFAIWGRLIALYPASMVAPFTLLVPGFGALSAWIMVGESFSLHRVAGSLLIVAGLAIIVFPTQLMRRKAKGHR